MWADLLQEMRRTSVGQSELLISPIPNRFKSLVTLGELPEIEMPGQFLEHSTACTIDDVTHRDETCPTHQVAMVTISRLIENY